MFKDPIKPNKGNKEPKFPWNFEAPKYDDRNLISAGTNYGVGFNQPIGTEKMSMKEVIPKGCKNMAVNDKKGY